MSDSRESRDSRGSRRRIGPEARARAAVVLLLLLALGVVAERARWFARLLGAAGVERVWIWSPDPPRKVEPRVFFATRDFELSSVSPSARLEVLGDPEYVVYLNGRRVGSGRASAAHEIDVYPVAPLLGVGSNRLVLELRSPTGSGAATVRLDDGEGRTVLAADRDWLIYRSAWLGLLAGEPFIPSGKARQLASSPFGRWSTARPGNPRPRFDQVVGEPEGAAAWRRSGETEWREMPAHPSRRLRLGGRVEIDLGRERTGYVYLLLDRRSPGRGMVRFGAELAEGPGWNPDAVVLTPAGRGLWLDSEPRRCRYLEIVGLDELTWVAVLPVAEAEYVRLASSQPVALLGAAVRPVRLPVVDEIWRRFGSSAGSTTAGEAGNPTGGAAGAPQPEAPSAPALRTDVATRRPEPAPGPSGRRPRAERSTRRALARPRL